MRSRSDCCGTDSQPVQHAPAATTGDRPRPAAPTDSCRQRPTPAAAAPAAPRRRPSAPRRRPATPTPTAAAPAGQLRALGGSAGKACQCGGTFAAARRTTPAPAARCVYNLGCQNPGGSVLVDPSTAGSNAPILPCVDGIEDYHDASAASTVNPELRAVGSHAAGRRRPHARPPGTTASRPATPTRKIAVPPYVLVQITDGDDTCDNAARPPTGPVAAAQGFVAATVAGAKNLNKVYVIGLAFGGAGNRHARRHRRGRRHRHGALRQQPAGHRGGARRHRRLVGAGREVQQRRRRLQRHLRRAVPRRRRSPARRRRCTNRARRPRPATTARSPARTASPPAASSARPTTLSEVCSAGRPCAPRRPTLRANPLCAGRPRPATASTTTATASSTTARRSSPTRAAPATARRAAAGGPFPETCNGCDDDCDGIVDNHLIDTGTTCGSNVGMCTPGTTFCCQQVEPDHRHLHRSPATRRDGAANPDKLVCLGGASAAAPSVQRLRQRLRRRRPTSPRRPATPGATAGCTLAAGMWTCNGICQTRRAAVQRQPCARRRRRFGACVGRRRPGRRDLQRPRRRLRRHHRRRRHRRVGGPTCCPTGNLADCDEHRRRHALQAGHVSRASAARAPASAAVAKAPETCNGIDDDCNGIIDDVPGIGAACTGAGIKTAGACTAAYQCMGTMPGPGPNGLTCTQTVGPSAEICNGIDDDCDGTIDNNLMDPRVGVTGGTPCTPLTPLPGTMFPNGMAQPPCKPGITACVARHVVCQGEVAPMPNQCNGALHRLHRQPQHTATARPGSSATRATASTACSGGEFPCPGGFVCDTQHATCASPTSASSSTARPASSARSTRRATPTASIRAPRSPARQRLPVRARRRASTATQSAARRRAVHRHPGQVPARSVRRRDLPAGPVLRHTGECVMICTGNCPPRQICLGGSASPIRASACPATTDEVCTCRATPSACASPTSARAAATPAWPAAAAPAA